jgi:hypothetical protein
MKYPEPASRTVGPVRVTWRRTFSARGPFRPLAQVEFDAVALFEILEAFAVNGGPMEEVFLPRFVLDEPETLVRS